MQNHGNNQRKCPVWGQLQLMYSGAIDSFRGDYRFLSNFYPCVVCYGGVEYPSVENAYQAAKTGNTDSYFESCTPGQAKRKAANSEVRSDWFDIRIDVMKNLVAQKFRNPHLRKLLIETYPLMLVEGNTWGDTFWGVSNERGRNNLGKILMTVRRDCLTGIDF